MDGTLFAGIKVLDVTRVIAGPFASYQLALHGAEVIHIEQPGEGDNARNSTDGGGTLRNFGMATLFLAHNAGKKSMTLNFASPQGQEIFRRLAKDADIVIENLRTGAMDRYGLGEKDLRALNPRLIYCSVTGYGHTGPKKNDAAMDIAIQAASGMMSICGTVETGPLKAGYQVADYATGYAAATALGFALYAREKTGRGQFVDVAMLETAMQMISANVTRSAITGTAPVPAGNRNGHGAFISTGFKCREGMVMVSAGSELRRQKLYKAIGRPDIPADARFATPELCRRNVEALEAEVAREMLGRTAAEWETVLNAAGVPCMKVNTVPEALAQEQIASRGFLHRFPPDPELGVSVIVPKAGYHLAEFPSAVQGMPPRLGQHTDEVLKGLGYDDASIELLRSNGTI